MGFKSKLKEPRQRRKGMNKTNLRLAGDYNAARALSPSHHALLDKPTQSLAYGVATGGEFIAQFALGWQACFQRINAFFQPGPKDSENLLVTRLQTGWLGPAHERVRLMQVDGTDIYSVSAYRLSKSQTSLKPMSSLNSEKEYIGARAVEVPFSCKSA